MTIHWKAVEQYFTVVLFVDSLAPRVKPWVIQTFDSMDRVLTYDAFISKLLSKFTVVLFVFQFLILKKKKGRFWTWHCQEWKG